MLFGLYVGLVIWFVLVFVVGYYVFGWFRWFVRLVGGLLVRLVGWWVVLLLCLL